MRFWIVLVLIVACLVGVGFYRGWFHLTSDRSGALSRVRPLSLGNYCDPPRPPGASARGPSNRMEG
jgi:hypothetical protein